MKPPRSLRCSAYAQAIVLAVASLLAPASRLAAESGQSNLQFRKPEVGGKPAAATAPQVQFRELPVEAPAIQAPVAHPVTPKVQASSNPLRAATAPVNKPAATKVGAATASQAVPADFQQTAKPLASAPRAAQSQTIAKPAAAAPAPKTINNSAALSQAPVAATHVVAMRPSQPRFEEPLFDSEVAPATFGHCEICGGGCDPECGVCDACCGVPEAGCGVYEPECGVCEGDICCEEPACGCAEPVGCGSCVGNPGPDYWCFPVCLPRIKELSFWGGVQGFKGPRDFIDDGQGNSGPGDSNFGFHEGVNVGGRAPLIGLIFPQLSYQLGYQALQNRLSGTSQNGDDRPQQFITAGLFRRVGSGLQYGVVWDWMRDDLIQQEDLHQLRYEVSLRSGAGREFGFWGASSSNSKIINGIEFEAVDQFCGFFRWNFRDGGAARIWGGGTGNSEGILGADFIAPLSARWSVQTGFNYLIPDAPKGPVAAQEESWNIGLGLVWHWGGVAKNCGRNPYSPLFPVADNGWMFVDQRN